MLHEYYLLAIVIYSRNVQIKEKCVNYIGNFQKFCRAWLKSGACALGIRCRFAHNIGELRPIKLVLCISCAQLFNVY